MKYIDVEKLKELINEKWKELADKNVKVGGGKWDAEISTYLSVLRLIDSLQQEQSTNQSIITKERKINMCTAKKHSQWCRIVNCKDCPHYTKGKK